MLEISGVTVRYEAHPAILKDFSLRIAPHERVAVLGTSGAGKTTLFRVINGFVKPAAGSIRVNGIEVAGLKERDLRALRSRIAVVSQRHDLVDELAVYQNVMAGALGRWSSARALRFLCRPNREELEEAESALQRVGLASKLRMRTSGLSGGEHQRVAIARALVQKPALLLADEPVASLDPELSEQILSLLCGLAAEYKVTLVCSLHQPELAHRYFDRIVELRDGRITIDRQGAGAPLRANEAPPFLRQGI